MNRLVWFRHDLRTVDNETLVAAVGDPGARVSYLFIYDQALDGLTRGGVPRGGPFRKRFIAESVIDLRDRLRARGADLICAYGDPVRIVPEVAAALEIDAVYHARYSTFDERRQDREIERRLSAAGKRLYAFDTHTLLHPADFPDVDFEKSRGYSKLRKIAETDWAIRQPLPEPTSFRAAAPAGPSLELIPWKPEAYLEPRESDRGIHLTGGETEAARRAEEYIWIADRLRVYKDTRNGLIDLDDSSKFSAALSVGCTSPRSLYAEVRRYERERIANGSTLWFLYELLWRDHFHFLALGRGAGLFTDVPRAQIKVKTPSQQRGSFERWCSGQTGKPFIDAAQTELRLTGWMSNRMRQNAASYLIHDLGVDWRWGAEWFESYLVDYDCASNWGNWSYVAGAGPMNSPHVFNVDQQERAYDRDGKYVEYWLS